MSISPPSNSSRPADADADADASAHAGAEAEVDHRSLAQRLDLLHFQEEAAGMVFWHPRGLVLYRLLEEAVRLQARAEGYREVKTPQILRRPIWEASGHWRHFADGMYRVDLDGAADRDGGQVEGAAARGAAPRRRRRRSSP